MADHNNSELPQITDPGEVRQLGPKTEVLLSYPQPEFDVLGAKAFVARVKGSGRADLLAYMCNSGLAPRSDIVPMIKNVGHSSFTRVLDSGVIRSPADDKLYYAFTTERPHLKRFLRDEDAVRQPISEDYIIKNFITPLTAAFIELEIANVGHGQVRLSNINWRDQGNIFPELGECIAVPSGVGQPAIYEPIDRALCWPAARGHAGVVDDMYAFGTCIAFLLLGQNPLRGLDDKAQNKLRLEKGSFNVLLANQRMSSGMLELLRALLIDDPHARWKPTDIDQWLGGRRQTALPAETGRKASRPLTIAGQDYVQPRPLAQALADNPTVALELVENGELDRWLKRSLMDEKRANFLAECYTMYQENSGGQRREDMLASYMCMAMDPLAPFSMKGVRMLPSGVGYAIAEAQRSNVSVQPMMDLLNSKAISVWAELQGEEKPQLVPLIQQMEKMRNLIEKSIHGYGPERVMYELCPSMPCQSPLMGGQYVNGIKDFLGALDTAAKRNDKPREPMDRHIAAWLVARDRRAERQFLPFSQNDAQGQVTTLMNIYGDIQTRHGPEKVPALCNWILPLLEPAIQRFKNKLFQEELRKALRSAAEKGNLGLMNKMANDQRLLDKDEREYHAAVKYIAALRREAQALEMQLKNPNAVAVRYGRPAATYVSSIVAAAIGMMTVLRGLLGG